MANCPICSGEFDVDNINGVTVAICVECDGMWLGAGDFDRVTQQDIETEFDGWMESPTECRHCQTPLGFGVECLRCKRHPTIHCPLGHGVMNAALVDIAGREFEIDHCPSCRGIWIDGHETEHLDAVEPSAARTLPVIAYSRPAAGTQVATSALGLLAGFDVSGNRRYGGILRYGPQPHMWGKREPGMLVFAVILGLAAVAAVYTFVAPMLIF